MTQQARNANRNETTLCQINAWLTQVGFPELTLDEAKEITSRFDREKFIWAARTARSDPTANAHLVQVFQTINGQQAPRSTGEPERARAPQHPAGAAHSPSQRQANTPPPSSANDESHPSSKEQPSVHVYGGKAALCFEADTTRSGVPTIALDGASVTAPRKYDWPNKTRIQLTKEEVPTVMAVLIGVLPGCEFKSHGPEKNKGFSIERQQGGKLFIKVFEGQKPVKAVPVEVSTVFHITSLFVRQIQLGNPWLDNVGVISLIRASFGYN